MINNEITYSQNQKTSFAYSFLIFLISPLLAVVISMRNFKDSWAKNIIWAFIAFYGYTFVISNEGMDANRYRDKFLSLTNKDITFTTFIEFLYDGETKTLDIVQPLVSFVVANITSNYHVLFAVFGIIFGYFYSRNIWYLLSKINTRTDNIGIFILITFAIVVGFWEINGFRFWTAAHVFFYGAMRYLWEGKKKYLLISFFSVFFHFAFFLPVAVLLLFSFLGNRTNIYFWVLIGSFFVSEINLDMVGNVLKSVLPEAFHSKANAYTSTEYAEHLQIKKVEKSLHAKIYIKGLKYFILCFFILVYLQRKRLQLHLNKSLYKLYNFSIYFLAIANVISLIPSGGRYARVSNLFAVAFIFLLLHHYPQPYIRKFRKLVLIGAPFLLLFNLVSARIGFDTIGFVTIIGNPLAVIFVESDIALIELLK